MHVILTRFADLPIHSRHIGQMKNHEFLVACVGCPAFLLVRGNGPNAKRLANLGGCGFHRSTVPL